MLSCTCDRQLMMHCRWAGDGGYVWGFGDSHALKCISLLLVPCQEEAMICATQKIIPALDLKSVNPVYTVQLHICVWLGAYLGVGGTGQVAGYLHHLQTLICTNAVAIDKNSLICTCSMRLPASMSTAHICVCVCVHIFFSFFFSMEIKL